MPWVSGLIKGQLQKVHLGSITRQIGYQSTRHETDVATGFGDIDRFSPETTDSRPVIRFELFETVQERLERTAKKIVTDNDIRVVTLDGCKQRVE